MRHCYSFLLLAVLSCIAGTNAWAYDFVADGIYYNITSSADLTVEVTYEVLYQATPIYVGDIVIPATVTNDEKTYNVTMIGNNAFDYCQNLTSVTIPESVTSIGYYAFELCRGLKSVNIPSGVTYIGGWAFNQCI